MGGLRRWTGIAADGSCSLGLSGYRRGGNPPSGGRWRGRCSRCKRHARKSSASSGSYGFWRNQDVVRVWAESRLCGRDGAWFWFSSRRIDGVASLYTSLLHFTESLLENPRWSGQRKTQRNWKQEEKQEVIFIK